MKKIIFLSSLIPKGYKEFYKKNSIGATSNANNNLQWAIVNGLVENNYFIKLINAPNIGAYPLRFKKILLKPFGFREGEHIEGINLKSLNINFFKHWFTYLKLKEIISATDGFSNETQLIIYDLYPPFLKSIKLIKSKNPLLKTILVVPDIYGLTGGKDYLINRLRMKIDQQIIDECIQYVDGFVLLTANMIERLPETAKSKPFIVIEGVLNPDFSIPENVSLESSNTKIILYTGSLDLRHGILNLMKAFIDAKLHGKELHICGDGDGKETVMKYSRESSGIRYLGQLTRKEVLVKQSEAFLLVNPRTSEGIFTKYSFPSKIIEYFASGTPTLMYKLEGIPKEYYAYCYFLENESIEALSQKLIELSNYPEADLQRKADAAKQFIMSEKNSFKQVQKIIDLFDRI